MKQIFLSVVIPAYNEESRLPKMLNEALDYLAKQIFDYEIIVVDDGSSDQTAEVAKQYSEKTIKVIKLSQNQGKAEAVKQGIMAAQGELVLFADADGSTPFIEIEKLLNQYQKGYPVVIGSRSDEHLIKIRQPFHRRMVGKLLRWLSKVMVLRDITDTQCGFKLFNTKLAKELFSEMKSKSPIFDIEILILAALKKEPIAEVPVVWINNKESKIPFSAKRALSVLGELWIFKKNYHIFWPIKTRTIT